MSRWCSTEGAVEGRVTTPFADAARHPGAGGDAAHARVGPDTIAKFLFTSGSTKDPKGVINTQRMLCANQQMLRQALAFLADEPPVLVDWLPWNHTFGGNHNVGLTLYNGGTLHIDEGKPTRRASRPTLRNLREISPTIYFNVPKGFEEIAAAMETDEALRESLFSRVQAFMFAGAGLSQAVWDQLDRLAVQTIGERIPVFTGLGMTETAPSCTFAVRADAVRSGHIGLPCPGVEVKLVPDGDGAYAKTEVRFRGPNVMPGYWREPALTAEAFDEEGFYRTGDAVRWVDPRSRTQGTAVRRPHRRGLQARHRHLRQRRAVAREGGGRRRHVRAGRRGDRAEPLGGRGAAVSAPGRMPQARGPAGRGVHDPEVLGHPAVREYFQGAGRPPVGGRHRQREPCGTGARAGRAAVDRQGRSHRQGFDQPARSAGAPRRAGRGAACRDGARAAAAGQALIVRHVELRAPLRDMHFVIEECC